MKKIARSHQGGFSLIELMVVVAIIAILSVIGISGYSAAMRRARDATRKSDIEAISQALGLFRMDWGRFPSQKEYFSDGESVAGFSEAHSFASYVPWRTLFDPSSRELNTTNGVPYVYFCVAGTSGTSFSGALAGLGKRCRQFLVCALMEGKGGGNFKLGGGAADNGLQAYLAGTGNGDGVLWVSKSITEISGGTIGTMAIDNSPNNQWYCAKSN